LRHRILRLKELPAREAQQVPAPLQLMHHLQVLTALALILVLLPFGAVPLDLTQQLLFRK
jgi:hypothetical protein